MSVTPDFIGQIYKDTATGNLWRANSLTAGDWTLEVVANQITFASGTLTGDWYPMAGLPTPGPGGITNFILSGLTTVAVGAHLDCGDFQDATLLSFPNLVNCLGRIDIDNNAALTTLDLSSLVTIGDSGYIPIASGCPLLSSINLDSFQTLSDNAGLDVGDLPAQTALSLPSFSTMGNGSYLTIYSLPITSLDLSSLTSVDTNALIVIEFNTGLTNISIPNVVFGGPCTVDFSDNALLNTTVNQVFARAVASPLFTGGGFIKVEGGTNAGPTGQGVTDKNTMVARGVTVTTN